MGSERGSYWVYVSRLCLGGSSPNGVWGWPRMNMFYSKHIQSNFFSCILGYDCSEWKLESVTNHDVHGLTHGLTSRRIDRREVWKSHLDNRGLCWRAYLLFLLRNTQLVPRFNLVLLDWIKKANCIKKVCRDIFRLKCNSKVLPVS